MNTWTAIGMGYGIITVVITLGLSIWLLIASAKYPEKYEYPGVGENFITIWMLGWTWPMLGPWLGVMVTAQWCHDRLRRHFQVIA